MYLLWPHYFPREVRTNSGLHTSVKVCDCGMGCQRPSKRHVFTLVLNFRNTRHGHSNDIHGLSQFTGIWSNSDTAGKALRVRLIMFWSVVKPHPLLPQGSWEKGSLVADHRAQHISSKACLTVYKALWSHVLPITQVCKATPDTWWDFIGPPSRTYRMWLS